jgi:hypothetical protein
MMTCKHDNVKQRRGYHQTANADGTFSSYTVLRFQA